MTWLTDAFVAFAVFLAATIVVLAVIAVTDIMRDNEE